MRIFPPLNWAKKREKKKEKEGGALDTKAPERSASKWSSRCQGRSKRERESETGDKTTKRKKEKSNG